LLQLFGLIRGSVLLLRLIDRLLRRARVVESQSTAMPQLHGRIRSEMCLWCCRLCHSKVVDGIPGFGNLMNAEK